MEIRNIYEKEVGDKINSLSDLRAVGKNIIQVFEEAREGSEEQKKKMLARIQRKLESGKKLTSEEMQFLQRDYPELYWKAKKIEIKRETVEEKLKHCKSKQEVEDVMQEEIGIISEKDPDKYCLIKAVEEAVKEFKKTSDYKKLPVKKEDAKENKKSNIQYCIKEGEYQTAFQQEENAQDFSLEILA